MTKDYVKINFAIDKKGIRDEVTRLHDLQEQGMYPAEFHMPMLLQFELTTHCNLFCRHCYNASGSDNKAQDAMTPEKWKDFARYLVANGGLFHCILSGGEPLLLQDDLFEIMDILHDDGTNFLVISNGLLMTKQKAKRFAKYRYRFFQISIDGATSEKHDDFRRRKGSFDKACNAVFMLSAYGIPVTIAHTVSPKTLDDIDEMCELAYQLGARTIIVGEVTPSGRSAFDLELCLSREQKNYMYEKVEENRAKYAGRLIIQRSINTKLGLMRYQNVPNHGAIIRPNGDVRLDCMAPFTMGNILEDDFVTLWREKSRSVWQDQRVVEYIESFDDYSDVSSTTHNYADSDLRL